MELSIQGLPIPASAKQCSRNTEFTTRRSANFQPSIWGDHFLAYSSDSQEADVLTNRRLQELKERVRNKLVANFVSFSEQLNFIDAIQRLGLRYHFNNEIDMALEIIHDTIYRTEHFKVIDDLYIVSLLFRLLRQQGYPVSSDIFKMFKDSNGKFKENITADIRGILSLYEAAYLRVRGEEILDEALDFTKDQLNFNLPNIKSPLKDQVMHALEQPIRTGLTRLEARAYLTFYEKDDSHDEILLEFAKLDFNLLQKMHQKELCEITRWWKELDFATKLPYVRDRVVECYFWMLGVYFEPEFALARRILLKVIAMCSVIDDTYDVYGTLEELAVFTDAIERWDTNAMAQLPEYMQIIYKALLDVYIMIEEEMVELERSYCVCYAKDTMKHLVRGYFEEAKWCNVKHVPTIEEYMKVATVTCAYITLSTTSFVGMSDIATESAFKWVSSNPLMVQAASVICRLQDDMVGHKFEQEREHVASAVECYMKQYNVSEEEVMDVFRKQITNAWKDLNAECLSPTEVSMSLLTRVLNLARVINVIYNGEDGYTNSTRIKGLVTSVLIDPVPV